MQTYILMLLPIVCVVCVCVCVKQLLAYKLSDSDPLREFRRTSFTLQ